MHGPKLTKGVSYICFCLLHSFFNTITMQAPTPSNRVNGKVMPQSLKHQKMPVPNITIKVINAPHGKFQKSSKQCALGATDKIQTQEVAQRALMMEHCQKNFDFWQQKSQAAQATAPAWVKLPKKTHPCSLKWQEAFGEAWEWVEDTLSCQENWPSTFVDRPKENTRGASSPRGCSLHGQ